jgi:hypothetical protein
MCCAEEFGDVFGQIKQTFAARKDNIKPIGFGERIIEEKKGGNELQECEKDEQLQETIYRTKLLR